jgi:isocitrate/isopropylmalate dehydrogenase
MKKEAYRITVLPGDGIGPEVVAEAVRVLQQTAECAHFRLHLDYRLVGGAAIDKFDTPLPMETLQTCKMSDAVLLGAIGAPQYDNLPAAIRPEKGEGLSFSCASLFTKSGIGRQYRHPHRARTDRRHLLWRTTGDR